MAFAGAIVPDRQLSPANLSSNNPFRRTAAASTSPRIADFPPPGRSGGNTTTNTTTNMSKNPFLDASELASPARDKPSAAATSPNFSADILRDLSLLDTHANGAPNANAQPKLGPPPRASTLPASGHGPSGSHDRRARPRRPPNPSGDVLGSPSKREVGRPRGNSESSAMEKERRREREDEPRRERTESEDRRRREKRKERDERHKVEKEKIRNGGKPTKPTKKPHGLDLIDKLDVTGIYGQGLFHHDGPFDACNPHRNNRKDRRAPMQAFPAGSANMALGGAGPLNSRIDLDKFHGRGEEGFADYATTSRAGNAPLDLPRPVKPERNVSAMNPTDRSEQVHGDESYGLGTSTFLEGAPASKLAMQRRQSDEQVQQQQPAAFAGGLQRKQSLVQRIRAISQPRRTNMPDYPNARVTSPDARYNVQLVDDSTSAARAIPAAGPARAQLPRDNEINPFESGYDAAYERKGAQIRIAEQERPTAGRARAPSPPGRGGLVRSVTADSSFRAAPPAEEEKSSSGGGGGGGGFLSRMRSLKGGLRARPERRGS